MKNLLLSLGLLLLLNPGRATAQDCKAFTLKQGSITETSSFDHKDRLTGRTVQQVRSLTTINGVVTATIHQQHFDGKGKALQENDFTMECAGGLLRLDMRAMAAQQESMRGMENMKVELSGTKLEMPAAPTAGQKLPDASLTMIAFDANSGQTMMRMEMQLTDRVVEAVGEKQTTAAGAYNCVRVSQQNRMNTVAMMIPMKFQMRSVSWYSPAVGPVRTEIYKGDKLTSYSVLTKVTN